MDFFTSGFVPPPVLVSVCLAVGCAADFVFGDPVRPPNPVRFFGALISRGEFYLNTGKAKALKGGFFSALVIAGVFFGFVLLEKMACAAGAVGYAVFSSLFVFFGLAGKSLITECGAVFRIADGGDIAHAKARLSMIVGRDTETLTPQQVKTAALETMSENLSDGFVAPVFFYALGGVPAMMAYKAVNTLDSMIGYKNRRFADFGKVAARVDDCANFVPARLTAFLMALCSNGDARRRAFSFIFRFGTNHPSPNAGFPQAALSGILDCRFGGVSYYGGRSVEKPFIGLNPKRLTLRDYGTAKTVSASVAVFTVAIAAVVTILI